MHSKIQSSNRTAMALNNIGVSLLERGMFSDAMLSLKDAVKVIQVGFSTKEGQSDLLSATDMDSIISAASRRMSRASTRTKTQLCPLRLVVCSIHDLPLVAKAAIEEGPTTSSAFAIRVEDLELDSGLYIESDLKSAIILHNFAVSYLCMSESARTKAKKDKLAQCATKIFAASHTVLIARQQSCADTDASALLRLVHACVLSNLVQLSASCCDRTTSTALYDTFVELRDVFYDEFGDYCKLQLIHTAAAA